MLALEIFTLGERALAHVNTERKNEAKVARGDFITEEHGRERAAPRARA